MQLVNFQVKLSGHLPHELLFFLLIFSLARRRQWEERLLLTFHEGSKSFSSSRGLVVFLPESQLVLEDIECIRRIIRRIRFVRLQLVVL